MRASHFHYIINILVSQVAHTFIFSETNLQLAFVCLFAKCWVDSPFILPFDRVQGKHSTEIGVRVCWSPDGKTKRRLPTTSAHGTHLGSILTELSSHVVRQTPVAPGLITVPSRVWESIEALPGRLGNGCRQSCAVWVTPLQKTAPHPSELATLQQLKSLVWEIPISEVPA